MMINLHHQSNHLSNKGTTKAKSIYKSNGKLKATLSQHSTQFLLTSVTRQILNVILHYHGPLHSIDALPILLGLC